MHTVTAVDMGFQHEVVGISLSNWQHIIIVMCVHLYAVIHLKIGDLGVEKSGYEVLHLIDVQTVCCARGREVLSTISYNTAGT